MTRKPKPKTWSFSAGERPQTVVVYERVRGGPLYARAWDPTMNGGRGGRRKIALKHRDREQAKSYALAQAAKLKQGDGDIARGTVRLSRSTSATARRGRPRPSSRAMRVGSRCGLA